MWEVAKVCEPGYGPEMTLILNNPVHDLVWSPHCQEILSVHGSSFQPPASPKRRRTSPRLLGDNATQPSTRTRLTNKKDLKIINNELTNSIVVHGYPSGRRLLTLTSAHREPIMAASLGPDGQCVFTASPGEKVIRLWRVWGAPPKLEREEKRFSLYTIR